ncbi:hypothetical protein TNCV_2824621 [Trichonephila clavipes]|nr:hypothetical protein TNCV_2824621 [Trichonephila clavipes]
MDGVRPSTGHEESSGFNNRVDCSTRSAEGIVVDGTREGFVTIRGAKTYASTHHGAQQGEAARRSSDMRQARHLPQRWYWEPVLETAELITSRLTGAGSLLPPVYGEAWAKGHATGTPDSTFPGTGRRTRQTCGSDSKTSLNITEIKNEKSFVLNTPKK